MANIMTFNVPAAVILVYYLETWKNYSRIATLQNQKRNLHNSFHILCYMYDNKNLGSYWMETFLEL